MNINKFTVEAKNVRLFFCKNGDVAVFIIKQTCLPSSFWALNKSFEVQSQYFYMQFHDRYAAVR